MARTFNCGIGMVACVAAEDAEGVARDLAASGETVFTIGRIERGEQLDGSRVAAGDVLLGLASSGVHSNGYSLVRRLSEDKGWRLNRPALFDPERLLIDALVAPTRIYVRSLLGPIRAGRIHALAHITGGGLLENVPRVLPKGLHAKIDADAWPQPRLMAFLQAQGAIEPAEMARTFNCGIGMVLAVAEDEADGLSRDLAKAGETALRIGRIEPGERGCTVAGSREAWSAREAWEARHLA
jgi:phosphoribosylformylglycinamidine cyclo-ligase